MFNIDSLDPEFLLKYLVTLPLYNIGIEKQQSHDCFCRFSQLIFLK